MTASGEDSVAKNPSPSVSLFPSIYDTYLCHEVANVSPLPESDLIDIYDKRLRTLQSSAGYFAKQDRFRDVERLQLETARVYMQNEEWVNAIRVLKPLWQTLSWRQGGWWQLVQEVDWALRDCARKVGDRETLIAVEWELLSNCFMAKPDWRYDFSSCLEDIGSLSTRSKVVVQVEKVKSCLAVTFGFATSQGNVGEKLLSQLIVSSRAHKLSAPIVLKYVNLTLQGGLRSIRIECNSERIPESSRDDGLVQLYNVPLKQLMPSDDSSSSSATFGQSSQLLGGASDLTFSPGVTKAFSFETLPRKPGDIEVVSATMYIEGEGFEFEVVATGSDHLRQHGIWMKSNVGLSKKKALRENSLATKILPRPPKIRIHIDNLRKSYFTDELVEFGVRITNNEGTEANVILQGHLLGQSEDLPSLKWTSNGEIRNGSEQGMKDERLIQYQGKPSTISLGLLHPKEIKQATLSFQAGSEAADYVLKLNVLYHLLTDPETLITNSFETEVVFEKPFEASYVVLPRVHPSPWPSYFSTDDDENSDTPVEDATVARGLRQNWSLTAKIASIVTEAVDIEDVSLRLLESLNDTLCKISKPMKTSQDGGDFTPDNTKRWQFDLELQKYSLDDCRSAKLNFLLEIKWRRHGTQNAPSVAHIAVAELVIPFGEPRVLASAHPQQGKPASTHLEYTIENPSMYVLKFNLSMETSDEFAFSGAKVTSIQLVPLSRHTVRYNIFPLIQGTWITPLFRVVDPYFNKTLKVQATEGFRSDNEGLHIWADAED